MVTERGTLRTAGVPPARPPPGQPPPPAKTEEQLREERKAGFWDLLREKKVRRSAEAHARR